MNFDFVCKPFVFPSSESVLSCYKSKSLFTTHVDFIVIKSVAPLNHCLLFPILVTRKKGHSKI